MKLGTHCKIMQNVSSFDQVSVCSPVTPCEISYPLQNNAFLSGHSEQDVYTTPNK